MGSKLMRVSRDWGMIWIMEVLSCLLGFHFYLSYASLLQVCCPEQIDLPAFQWVRGQGGDRAKSLWDEWGVNVANAHGQFDESISCGTAP